MDDYYLEPISNYQYLMTLLLENSLPVNNYISISKKIQRIPLFFIHFLPINNHKNMDKQYKLLPESNDNLVKREIKYKLVHYGQHVPHDTLCLPVFSRSNFAKSLYHLFVSCSLLHKHNISFTMSTQPFVTTRDDELPLLHEFSYSFHFPSIRMENLKLYFPRTLLNNPYIPIDVFIITHLLHEPNINTNTNMDEHYSTTLRDSFISRREKIEINSINSILDYFTGYNSSQIIGYLLQFKYSWSYYSLCYYFVETCPELLEHFSLTDLFQTYIRSTCDRRDCDIVKKVHRTLFMGTVATTVAT